MEGINYDEIYIYIYIYIYICLLNNYGMVWDNTIIVFLWECHTIICSCIQMKN